MSKYLYGASVQGIQEFIFETNKLKEIIGASELVKEIESLVDDVNGEILLNTAGNIRIIFDNKEEAQKLFLNLPKKIAQKAYGITVSEAIVKLDGDYPTENDFFNLENRLKAQRNMAQIPLDFKLSIIKKAQKSAKSAYGVDEDGNLIDKASKQKRNASKKVDANLKDFGDISNSKNKLAIIHADGNGLGMIVPKIAKAKLLKDFSKELDNATKKAYEKAREGIERIRKIILGGDDLSVIIDADYALKFTRDFLKYFEKYTQEFLNKGKFSNLKIPKLTACAGISITNEKYPFYYAYALAEELTSVAKKISKSENVHLPPSSLMFHNIQSGNFQNYEILKKRELMVTDEDGNETYFDFGPYYLNETPKIDDFIEICDYFYDKDSPKSKFREWLKSLSYNKNYAEVTLIRINEMALKKWKKYNEANKILEKLGLNFDKPINEDNKTPIFEIIEIVSNTKAKK